LAWLLGRHRQKWNPQQENDQRQERASHTTHCSRRTMPEGENSRHKIFEIVGLNASDVEG
jgi:hypothetical protein